VAVGASAVEDEAGRGEAVVLIGRTRLTTKDAKGHEDESRADCGGDWR